MNLIIKTAEKINKFINIFLIKEIYAYYLYFMGIGDWGLGIGDWAQYTIPKPQFPNPNSQIKKIK